MAINSRALWLAAAVLLAISVAGSAAQILATPPKLGERVQPFIRFGAGRYALTHMRVIDGTGAAPLDDRTVLIDGPRILAVRGSTDPLPARFRPIDLSGASVMPGLVGMHDHMYYIARPNLDAEGRSDPPILLPQMTFSAPILYLTHGVTTVRTTGSVEPF